MSTNPEQTAAQESIDLKDPALAAFLAWLVPGLGHLYQRRIAKAVLFFVCIFGTFAYGCYLGGSRELGWGRVVYYSRGQGKNRWPYFCQIGVGLPALPALWQAYRCKHNKKVLFGGFMAPPTQESERRQFFEEYDQNRDGKIDGAEEKAVRAERALAREEGRAPWMGGGGLNSDQPTENELHRQLHRYFELGTVYTMIAGLLNILAIYDAWGGPVFSEPAKKEDEDEEEDEADDEADEDADKKETAEADTANEPAPDAAEEDNASDEKE